MQLSAAVPRLRTPVVLAEGKPYQGAPNVTTWVLFLLAADGRIVRGRPQGSWTSMGTTASSGQVNAPLAAGTGRATRAFRQNRAK